MGHIICCREGVRDSFINNRISLNIQKQSRIQTNPFEPQSFFPTKYLGRGIYGSTIEVVFKNAKQKLAMKVLYKSIIQEQYLFTIQTVLKAISLNDKYNRVKIWMTSEQKLYIVMEKMVRGDLYFHLIKNNTFNEEVLERMCIEIILALQNLHKKGIIYRQLKPQNVLMTNDGYLKLNDYFFSIPIQYANTYFGAVEYAAPQIFKQQKYDYSVDIWAFGIFLYELATKQIPFNGESVEQIKQKIQNHQYLNIIWKQQQKTKLSTKFMHLVQNCLHHDPTHRIKLDDIKQHQFFQKIKWDELQKKYLPSILNMISKQKIGFRDQKDPLVLPHRFVYLKESNFDVNINFPKETIVEEFNLLA